MPVVNYTTVCICGDGVVYDLGKDEYPPQSPHKDGTVRSKKYLVIDSFTCTVEEAKKLIDKKKKKK